MKYIFPRQFGLHNVFTSQVDTKETAQPFKDYTLREQEIAASIRQLIRKRGSENSSTACVKHRVPKRLRGQALDLVKRFQQLHSRCSYHELLKHHCPQNVSMSLHASHTAHCLSSAESAQCLSSAESAQSPQANQSTQFKKLDFDPVCYPSIETCLATYQRLCHPPTDQAIWRSRPRIVLDSRGTRVRLLSSCTFENNTGRLLG